MAVIGIDLGTTNSLVSCWKNGEAVLIPNSLGSVLTPSAVSVSQEEILVGDAAKQRLLTHGNETAVSFKCFMGTKKKYQLGSQIFTPIELSALVLKKLKQDAQEYLNEPIEEAIITVPAYFNDRQRTDTKLAAKIAGLKVERLINEPSAAALAYQTEQEKEEAVLLVIDFGGGTLDISLVECFDNVIEIEAVTGDNHLGGDDIDALIYTDFIGRHPELSALDAAGIAGLKTTLIQAKCALGSHEEYVFSYTYGEITIEDCIRQEQLLELGLPVLERMRYLCGKAVHDGQCSIDEIDDVVMVGGSSNLGFVQKFIEELFGKPPIVMANIDEVVARGTGIYAGIRMRAEDIKDRMMTDVCPFTLGTNVVWGQEDERPHLCVILERNCPLPFSKTIRLLPVYDYQDMMRIGVYQGEEYYVDENVCLGELVIPIRPRPVEKGEGVCVTFSYDINGVLQVEAENSMKEVVRKLIANDALSEKEIEESLRRFEQMKLPDAEEEEYQLLLAKLMWLFQQQIGDTRIQTGMVVERLTRARESNKHHLYQKEREFSQWYLVQTSMTLNPFASKLLLEEEDDD